MDSAVRIVRSEGEVAAATREGQIELFFPSPTGVFKVHLSLRLAALLAFWILNHWIWTCWFGLRVYLRERKLRKLVLPEQKGD